MKVLLVLISWLWLAFPATAQIENPVRWSFSSKLTGTEEAEIILKADIQPGWHIYSQFIPKGGPIATSFSFDESRGLKLIGNVEEFPKASTGFDKNFDMDIAWHDGQVNFRQRVQFRTQSNVRGSLEFMACNDQKCLPPTEVSFDIPIEQIALVGNEELVMSPVKAGSPVMGSRDTEITISASGTPQSQVMSYVKIFLAGFIGGLAAFFMPCIYPMIPLTISYFTKRGSTKSRSVRMATMYGLSIIGIYVGLGLLITVIFGSSALNEAASSATFNLIFFAFLVIFALSFMGAFEISLPSKLVNKMDEKSGGDGISGMFFMAFTLALVSFSCTGPIIGTLLVDAVSMGSYYGPALGMLGFSVALAMPFTLFALFPTWLKELPKSDSWLNTVKVSLGFLELALAFKYLSNVDLAYHWGVIDRTTFLSVWIVIFATLGFYLAGKIRFKQDSVITFVSHGRLLACMIVFVFTVYMVPGVFGAPLEAINAWLPPASGQSISMTGQNIHPSEQGTPKKYSSLFHAPYALDAFYDYDEALQASKKLNKPVLIDFTGWSCTNCRKMETSVWSDPAVLKQLRNDYILLSLYVDDKTELPVDQQYLSALNGRKIKNLGQKWSDFQATTFGTNSQPFYVIVNANGEKIAAPHAFDLDIKKYLTFLENGKMAFKAI